MGVTCALSPSTVSLPTSYTLFVTPSNDNVLPWAPVTSTYSPPQHNVCHKIPLNPPLGRRRNEARAAVHPPGSSFYHIPASQLFPNTATRQEE